MQVFSLRAMLIVAALCEGAWGALFYFDPSLALGGLGRAVIDPVIARQYPLYLASGALAYLLAAFNPLRYSRVLWVCVIQRAVELLVACVDRHARAISFPAFLWILAGEAGFAALALAVLRMPVRSERSEPDPGDRGLTIALRCFGGLELFWFFASTLFVQVGSRLLGWKLQDPFTTQQQGIALLAIGLICLLAASDVARYRIFVSIPIFSQLIGVANAFNEIRLGSISWSIAAIQWTIELTIVFAFAWLSRRRIAATISSPAPLEST